MVIGHSSRSNDVRRRKVWLRDLFVPIDVTSYGKCTLCLGHVSAQLVLGIPVTYIAGTKLSRTPNAQLLLSVNSRIALGGARDLITWPTGQQVLRYVSNAAAASDTSIVDSKLCTRLNSTVISQHQNIMVISEYIVQTEWGE